MQCCDNLPMLTASRQCAICKAGAPPADNATAGFGTTHSVDVCRRRVVNRGLTGTVDQTQFVNIAGAPLAENVTAGFVQTHGVGVCRGRYAPALRRAWHTWDKRNGSENDAPDMFPKAQVRLSLLERDSKRCAVISHPIVC